MRILIPTDFSECANNAIEYAMDLYGRKPENSFIIVHTCNFIDNTDLELEAKQKQLEELRYDIINEYADCSLEIDVQLYQGTFVNTLNFCFEKYQADIMVVGTKGASSIKSFFVGTNAEELLENTSFPMLIVPEQSTFSDIQNLGYATKEEEEIGEHLMTLAENYNAKIRKVTIGDVDEVTEIHYEKVGANEDGSEVPVFRHLIHGSDIELRLRKFINEYKIDLLCMNKREHNAIYRLLHGNLINEFVFDSSVPLLFEKGK